MPDHDHEPLSAAQIQETWPIPIPFFSVSQSSVNSALSGKTMTLSMGNVGGA